MIIPMSDVTTNNETVCNYKLEKDKGSYDCYVVCFSVRSTRLVSKCLCPYSPYFVHTQLGFLEGSRK